MIFDAGFAGIAMPREYGGAGLTLDHQAAWAQETRGREVPDILYVSIGVLGVTLLEHGAPDFVAEHLPRILRGQEVWLQMLSEPSGGSDMAAVTTRAVRAERGWVLNGAKIWTSLADRADWGMCLARSDRNRSKHGGLSMFAIPLAAPGVTITPIIGLDGGPAHFFQEFLDDVAVPANHLVGGENDGWRVARDLLKSERNAITGVGHGLGLRQSSVGESTNLVAQPFAASTTHADPVLDDAVVQNWVNETVRVELGKRISTGMRVGAIDGSWGSVLKLSLAAEGIRSAEVKLRAAGIDAVIWDSEDPAIPPPALSWLTSRRYSIAGGTNEIQRNIISERILKMPRERAIDNRGLAPEAVGEKPLQGNSRQPDDGRPASKGKGRS
jgi:alkylation response protein AidB-like acyl-CoA dehydrogenase